MQIKGAATRFSADGTVSGGTDPQALRLPNHRRPPGSAGEGGSGVRCPTGRIRTGSRHQPQRRQPGRDTTRLPAAGESFRRRCEETEPSGRHPRARRGNAGHLKDARGPIYAISLAFGEPRELCYQLVGIWSVRSRKGRRRRGDEDGGHRQAPGPPYERPPNSQTGRLETVTA